MPIDRSIHYVREHRIAPLLNDMVMHLLTTRPLDPVTALIGHLERHSGISPGPLAPAPQPETAAAAEAPPPPPPPPPPQGAAGAPGIGSAPNDAPPPDDALAVIQALESGTTLTAAILQQCTDAAVDEEEQDAARKAVQLQDAARRELANVRMCHERVVLASRLAASRAPVTAAALNSTAFSLLRELDERARELNFVPASLLTDTVSEEDAMALRSAAAVHAELLSLVESGEAAQIQIEQRLLGGSTQPGDGARCAIAATAAQIAGALQMLRDRVSGEDTRTAAAAGEAMRAATRAASSEDTQLLLVRQLLDAEAAIQRTLQPLAARRAVEDDGDAAAAREAVRTSEELAAVAATALRNAKRHSLAAEAALPRSCDAIVAALLDENEATETLLLEWLQALEEDGESSPADAATLRSAIDAAATQCASARHLGASVRKNDAVLVACAQQLSPAAAQRELLEAAEAMCCLAAAAPA